MPGMTCVACDEAHSSVLHFGAAPDTSRGEVTVAVLGVIGLMAPSMFYETNIDQTAMPLKGARCTNNKPKVSKDLLLP